MTTDKTPQWLTSHIRAGDGARIASHIQNAEKKTSGEIVVMLVRQSMRYGHVYPLCALILFALSITLLYFWTLSFAWQFELSHNTSLSLAGLLLISSQALAYALSKSDGVKRLLTKKADIAFHAEHRAKTEFYEAGLYKTAGQTGILIFVSFTEHRVVVLGDKGIAEKIEPQLWDELISTVTTAIKKGELGVGLSKAVDLCGAVLTKHFPIADNDKNELPNHFIVKE